MKITSHFVWIKLNSEVFADLYTDLQEALWENDSVLEFQNILSIHVTLYYLSATITNIQIEGIREVLNGLRPISIRVNNFSYFWHADTPSTGYISVDNLSELRNTNERLKMGFPEFVSIPDNAFDFIPHITVFKIRDPEIFSLKRLEIENIVSDHLFLLQKRDVFESFGIFKVNSEFRPEIQIKL